jgi:hypothetical protein
MPPAKKKATPPASGKPAKNLPPWLAKIEAGKQSGSPATGKAVPGKPAAAKTVSGTTASKASSASSAAAAYKGPVPTPKKKKSR